MFLFCPLGSDEGQGHEGNFVEEPGGKTKSYSFKRLLIHVHKI
jgi:hypothetical protein